MNLNSEEIKLKDNAEVSANLETIKEKVEEKYQETV